MTRVHRASGPSLRLDFDAEAAEEKALVRLRQAGVAAPGRMYVLRGGGAVLEAVAIGLGLLGTLGAATVMFGGTGDVLGSPRGVVAAALLLASLLVALLIGVTGQLLVAQAAVARNTQLMTSILAEMNHTITASVAAQPGRPAVVVTAVPETVDLTVGQ